MTCMTLVLLGNYAQTGHFGGPLAYTPFNVVTHLAGPERGGLRFDYRRPKHPYQRQVHARRGPLRAHLLRAVDDHGRGARAEIPGHRRSALLRGAGARDAAGRRARLPPRRRRAEDAARRTTASPIIRCSRRPRAAASARCPATSSRPTSPTTSTAGRRASASRPPPAKPRSGTSSAPPSTRRRSSRSKASSRCAPATRRN